ncbi:hypothetical protein GCM10025791_04750 [Halioxenophilus aromaticivorans]|uniref:Uncharacterized protein n=1 Tax=Halioxenophilus aromaticivorans TaxID=1306992 RepID=A0AAV3TY00_9ALTE
MATLMVLLKKYNFGQKLYSECERIKPLAVAPCCDLGLVLDMSNIEQQSSNQYRAGWHKDLEAQLPQLLDCPTANTRTH